MSPATEERAVVLTEGTHIKVSIPRAIAAVVGIVGIVATVYAFKVREDNHFNDTYRHLDPRFPYDHGQPVGSWDLRGVTDKNDADHAAMKAATDQLRADVSALRQVIQDMKPRWRP